MLPSQRSKPSRLSPHPGPGLARKFSILLVVTFVGWAFIHGQVPTQHPASIEFRFDNPGLDPTRYSVLIDETGKGHYRSEPGAPSHDPDSAALSSQPREVDIMLSPATRDFLFTAARSRKFFAIACDDGKGKVAFQGKKDLVYTGSDGHGSCTYNWSKDERIERLTRIFEGISLTIETGGRLAVEHRHDPLALDHELRIFQTDVKEGRAAEVGNIAAELRSIAQDESVMVRARSTAAMLLAQPAHALD